MAKDNVRHDYSNDEIIKIVLSLGSEDYRTGSSGELIFQTVCHHGKAYKLYYYPESCLFHCYTDCGDSFDVYELVKRSRECSFESSIDYINCQLGLSKSRQSGFLALNSFTDDWEILNRYAKQDDERGSEKISFTYYPNSLIDYYARVYPIEWEREGIQRSTMDKYKIRYDIANNKIVIPQFDVNGKLIGIRARALNKSDIDAGRKYMPVIIEKDVYRHPTAYNLYGLYENQQAIRRIKKIVLFEAEKSVMKCDEYYGEDNFTVAVCGSNISNYQRNLILSLGVKEVFLAFDKEYESIDTTQSDDYAEKILNLAYKFCPYTTTYVLWDTEGLLGYKDSPADKGKEVLEKLMKSKIEVITKED